MSESKSAPKPESQPEPDPVVDDAGAPEEPEAPLNRAARRAKARNPRQPGHVGPQG
ncbi:hypothetical protein I4I84_32070, partial [Pseudonocardia sp. KRD-182]|nr:hypothetical protein [Pseudonocardia oceani]